MPLLRGKSPPKVGVAFAYQHFPCISERINNRHIYKGYGWGEGVGSGHSYKLYYFIGERGGSKKAEKLGAY